MAIGPSPDGFSYLLDDTDNTLTLSPGFLAPYPGGLIALGGNDRIRGSSDAEIIYANTGEDTLNGGSGNDTLFGGKDRDFIYGEDGDDFLNGNIGQDFVEGGNGNDFIRGGKDEDLLVSGNGNDTLIGDMGVDALAGNAGSDLFVLRTDTATSDQFGADIILDFDKFSDRIAVTGTLTEADLILQSINQPIQELLSQQGYNLRPTELRLTTLLLTGADIDPNGDGIASGTQIKIAATGEFLGYALNVTPADLSGHFVNVPVI
ncbi:calcium-binding protein [Argonema galeatum]|uniref:calcium-binding protein n=1 Tax=Argonema galeatum TaxID=2942762 RepID=UPI0020114335|nr:calcium-binding protein [Argonema galeatum]MCL1463088.1 calcium-binding protein [Argonema galeatum A003/A1]